MRNEDRLHIMALLFVGMLVAGTGSVAAQCRVDQRFGSTTPASSAVYKTDLNENLGDWGTIFMAADTDTGACLTRARDFLMYKLKSQNQDLNRWKGGLMGGDVMLVTAAALRLRTQGLLTSEIHNDILSMLASYDFAHWGGPCGRQSGNGCMDDYTVAAAGHAWAGAYLGLTQSSTWNGRDSGWFRGEAKRYIKLSLSPKDSLCVRSLSDSQCASCSDEYNAAYDGDWISGLDAVGLRNKIVNEQAEVLSFEHGYENPSYGVGLLTLLGAALQGLEVAGDSYVANEFQKVMVHGLFRTGQGHAPWGGTVCQANWLNNCVGINCSSMAGVHCLAANCDPPPYGCADDPGGDNPNSRAYAADMFPVKPLLDDARGFKLNPDSGWGIESPIFGADTGFYQFTDFCSSRFKPEEAFRHDGRYAAYYQIPYVWRYVRSQLYPPTGWVDGYNQQHIWGWACDPDYPTQSNRVDIYTTSWQYLGSADANHPSSAPINSICRGGSAHYFDFYHNGGIAPGTHFMVWSIDLPYGVPGNDNRRIGGSGSIGDGYELVMP
ncbi:MAG: hypothetical protein ACJ76N_14960 [Thermoanaerobaculia bacterium]